MCAHRWRDKLNRCLALLASAVVSACASTPYRDIPVQQLNDQQLADEFVACAAGVGREVDRAQLLIATKPDSLYVLSSSTTNYFGTSNAVASGYAVPTRYGYSIAASGFGTFSGTAQTSYYYSDVNAYARLLHDIGAAIAEARGADYRRRGAEVLAEVESRSSRRRIVEQQSIDVFFDANRNLVEKKALTTAILAWLPPRSAEASSDQNLERAKAVIAEMKRGPGIAGDWYGIFSTETTLQNGRKIAINNFVRVTIGITGERCNGTGELGTGEKVEIDCRLVGDQVAGTVTNKGAGLVVAISGRLEPERAILEYQGGGAQLKQVGRVALFR
jgi:hypothetical protein